MRLLFIAIIIYIFQLPCILAQDGDLHDTAGKVQCATDRVDYSGNDTIRLTLTNGSEDAFVVGLRCGRFLEMSFQRMEDDRWSEDQWFDYMALRCMTVMDTVQAGHAFSFDLPAAKFGPVGTFRLAVKVFRPGQNDTEIIFSDTFRVE